MMSPTVSLAYRRAALQQASTVGLVIALYDTLAGNLTRAAAAMESNHIEIRCAELVHGFKILQQLDIMLDMQRGGETAVNIRRFYTHLRGQMLLAQFKLDPTLLQKQARLLLEVREVWQQVDSTAHTGSHLHTGSAVSDGLVADLHPMEMHAGSSRMPFSCSG